MSSQKLSNYPTTIDELKTLPEYQDMTIDDKRKLNRYNSLLTKNNLTFDEQQELLNLVNSLKDRMILSEDWNKVVGAITNLETYFKEEVLDDIDDKLSGLNDIADTTINKVNTAKEQMLNDINSIKNTTINDVNTVKSNATSSITNIKDEAISEVSNVRNDTLQTIKNEANRINDVFTDMQRIENEFKSDLPEINNSLNRIEEAEPIIAKLKEAHTTVQDDIAAIESTGNQEVIVRSSDWILNNGIYEKEITHDLYSENLHITAKDLVDKTACTIGWKILDKSRLLLKSDTNNSMSIVLSASYYKATQTISDDIVTEVVQARGGEMNLDTRLNGFYSTLMGVAEDLENTTLNKSHTFFAKALEDMYVYQSALKYSQKAIKNGELRIAFWADSITEGADLSNLNDKYATRVIDKIQKTLPMCRVVSQNFGLGGRSTAHACSESYVAISSKESSVSQGFYREWSVKGKSWREHIKDFKPDLIVIAFGMNDSGSGHINTASYDFITNLKIMLDYIKTFDKKADVILVPTILPTTNQAIYSQRQDITNSVARACRELAKEEGIACADANRLFRMLRDGIDECSFVSNTVVGFDSKNYFGEGKNKVAVNGGVITLKGAVSGDRLITNKQSYNQIIELNLKINTTAGFSISLRNTDLGRFDIKLKPNFQTEGDTFVQVLDANSNQISSGVISGKALGSSLVLKIVSEGARHVVYESGKVICYVYSFKNLHDGHISFNFLDTTSEISNLKIIYNDNIKFAPIYLESELLGEYNNDNTDGNGINHPTPLGHEMVYFNSFIRIIQELSASYIYDGLISKDINIINKFQDLPTGESSFYLNFTGLSERYDVSKGIQLKHMLSNKFYNFREDLKTTDSSSELKSNEFCYINTEEGIDQIIVSRDKNDSYEYKLYISERWL